MLSRSHNKSLSLYSSQQNKLLPSFNSDLTSDNKSTIYARKSQESKLNDIKTNE